MNALLSRTPQYWDEIIRKMGSSTLLSKIEIGQGGNRGGSVAFISSMKLNPLKFKPSQEIYTSVDFETRENEYVIVVSLAEIMKIVLDFGLSGISVITPEVEVFMSRHLLIEKHDLINEHCSDRRLKKSYNFLFIL